MRLLLRLAMCACRSAYVGRIADEAVQPLEGVTSVAAMLLLHLSAPDAFIAHVNLYQKSLVRSFHFKKQDEVRSFRLRLQRR